MSETLLDHRESRMKVQKRTLPRPCEDISKHIQEIQTHIMYTISIHRSHTDFPIDLQRTSFLHEHVEILAHCEGDELLFKFM